MTKSIVVTKNILLIFFYVCLCLAAAAAMAHAQQDSSEQSAETDSSAWGTSDFSDSSPMTEPEDLPSGSAIEEGCFDGDCGFVENDSTVSEDAVADAGDAEIAEAPAEDTTLADADDTMEPMPAEESAPAEYEDLVDRDSPFGGQPTTGTLEDVIDANNPEMDHPIYRELAISQIYDDYALNNSSLQPPEFDDFADQLDTLTTELAARGSLLTPIERDTIPGAAYQQSLEAWQTIQTRIDAEHDRLYDLCVKGTITDADVDQYRQFMARETTNLETAREELDSALQDFVTRITEYTDFLADEIARLSSSANAEDTSFDALIETYNTTVEELSSISTNTE